MTIGHADRDLPRSGLDRARHVGHLFRAALSAPRSAYTVLGSIVPRLDQFQSDMAISRATIEHRISSLEAFVRQLHDDDRLVAAQRHTSIYDLLTLQHQTTWDSDRRLHDSLLRRLASIERAVRAHEPAPAHGGTQTRPLVAQSKVAAEVRDFLDLPDTDLPSEKVAAGSFEVEVPAWDTVILPWLREHAQWEPGVGEALRDAAKVGGVVLDVGAHVGIFTLALSAMVGARGRVIAVEADPINARFLRRNLARSHCANVLVLAVAAADKAGTVTLSRSIHDNTGDSRTYDLPTSGNTSEVPAIALDDVVLGPVDLIKLDLQGTDHVAMRGMARIIAEYRPTIVTEFWPEAIREYGDQPAAVLNWFRELGYSWKAVQDAEITDALPDEDNCAAAEALATGYVDLVLKPARLKP